MDIQSSAKTLDIPKTHSTSRQNLKTSSDRFFHKQASLTSFSQVKDSALYRPSLNSSKPSIRIDSSHISDPFEIIRKVGPGRSNKNKITYKRKSSYKAPETKNPLLSSQTTLEFNKNSQFSKSIDDKNLIRLRMFDVEVSKGRNLMYGLPFQKYNKLLMQDPYFQGVLIKNELNVLKDRVNSLNFRLAKVRDIQNRIIQLFGLIRKENQQSMNAKIEETIGILKEISRSVLFEYGDNPSFINISSFPHLPNNNEVTDEHQTFIENASLFNFCTKAFGGSVVGYNVLSRNKNKILDLHDNLVLFQFLARARLNVNELLEETSFHQKYQFDKVSLARSIYSLNGSPSAALDKHSANIKIAQNAASLDDNMWNEIMNAIAIGANISDEDEKNIKKVSSDIKKVSPDIKSRSFQKSSSSVLPALKKLEKLPDSNIEINRSAKPSTDSIKHPQFSNISNIYESLTIKKIAPSQPKHDLKSYHKLKVKKAIEEAIRLSKFQSIVIELRKIDPDKL